MKRAVFFLAALAWLAIPASAAADTLAARIDPILEQQKQELHIPGMALVAVRDGKVVYAKAIGQRDIEAGLPATLDTLFPIGSCTKAFTSMVLALSADAGLLSFDDPPRKFLPWFKMADPEADANVKLRDMLAHRTGLMAYADLAAEPGVLTPEEFILAATGAKPSAKFGTKFQYSNPMYVAAGLIAGEANKSSWESVVQKRIYAPLGMTASKTSLADALKAPDHATGYAYDPAANAWHAVPPSGSLTTLAPAGAVVSSANDMAKWLQMLADGGAVRGKRFVSEKMFAELTSAQTPMNPKMSYGLGWAVYDWNGLKVVEHNGGTQGISALVSFVPARRTGFLILTNSSPTALTKITAAGKMLWPILLDQQPAPAAAAAPPVAQAGPPGAPEAGLPSAEQLIARMVAAIGGEKSLKRHSTLTIHAVKSYENQGVTADVSLLSEAPASMEAVEVWHAAGKEIGRVRVYFDGKQGGQETTFGQDSINGVDENAQALRDYAFLPPLGLRALYKTAEVLKRNKAGDEDAYILQLTPEKGDAVTLTVSAKSALILERKTNEATESLFDYREVKGVRISFRSVVHDQLGESVIEVKDATFDVKLPPDAFKPQKPGR